MDDDSTLKKISKDWRFWLITISVFAIIIRSIPAWWYAAWGCDFGIYYGITNSVIESGEFFGEYTGWGNSYNEFPVLYAIGAFAHWITGIDLIVIMPKLIPIFGGLTVTIFYFIVNELTRNRKVSLLAALILAVLPFHVYQLSHASPLTVGHFFMMLSMFLFIKYREDMIYIFPLMISTFLLIMSHHLTTYFYLASIIFIVFIENASRKEWSFTVKRDIVCIVATSIMIFSYWSLVARTVYEGFMRSGLRIFGFRLESIFIVALFYVAIFGMFFLVWLKRRYNLFYSRKKPTRKENIIKFSSVLIATIGILLIFTVIDMPRVNFTFPPISILFSIPLIVIIGLGVVGLRYTYFMRNGYFMRAWIFAILGSFIFSLLTNNSIILPHRHLEYMMIPLALIAVYGLGGLFYDPNHHILFSWLFTKKDYYLNYMYKKMKISYRNRIFHVLFVVILVVSLSLSVYPSHRALNQSVEEITFEDILALEWMKENLDQNTSVITSDHRLEQMIWAFGFNISKDETEEVWKWTAADSDKYLPELYGIGKNYSRITHIVIDDVIMDVFHRKFGEPGFKISEEFYNKFEQQPFELIYPEEKMHFDPITNDPIHWCEVYRVNWSYIETQMIN